MKNSIFKRLCIYSVSTVFLASPFVVSAVGQFVECDGVDTKCNFSYLIGMINNIIDFLVFSVTVPFAAILFAYSGYLFIMGGNTPATRQKAIGVLKTAVIGLIFTLGAWLMVSFVINGLEVKDEIKKDILISK